MQIESGSLSYAADTSEVNDLTIERLDDARVLVTDPGATIAPGTDCVTATTNAAVCTLAAPGTAVVTLADGDDTLHSDLLVLASAGEGNDKLFGSAENDELDGGQGADELHGGDGADALYDGDIPTALSHDLLDGGSGTDLADYRDRQTGLAFDLRMPVTGLDDEADQLTDVENVYGGTESDILRGGDSINELWGYAGRDTLAGRGGNDYLSGGLGEDRSWCGSGDDTAVADRRGDYIAPDCELVVLDHPDATLAFDPQPDRRTRRALRFTVGCPTYVAADAAPRCEGKLTLRTPAGKLLGRGRAKPADQRRVSVRLTRAGRRLASRRDGVRATVTASLRTVDGERRATFGYTTRIKSHR